jgi:hypothetical protein
MDQVTARERPSPARRIRVGGHLRQGCGHGIRATSDRERRSVRCADSSQEDTSITPLAGGTDPVTGSLVIERFN